MSKKLSFKGSIIPGTDAQRIKLATLDGKTGYQITKFKIISSTPGGNSAEYICQIHTRNEGPSNTVDFTNDSLMAVAYNVENTGTGAPSSEIIIFDNKVVNQDIYVSGTDAAGGVVPFNFYFEMEVISLSDAQSTQLTLRSMRNIHSA